MTTAPLQLRIGMFGLGTVGGGVYNLIQRNRTKFLAQGLDIVISKICVRNPTKVRPEVNLDSQTTTLVTNYSDILQDTKINCIIELIGGVDDAKDIVFQAIEQQKHVITANKALVANHLPTLSKLLQKYPQVQFGYEAAVCGGIPIIQTLQSAYPSDTIQQVVGILNGTTNFMLSKMDQEKAAYDQVLAEAQRLGFAEANPSADVDGFDVQSKIALLSKLAFGTTIDPQQVPTTGITRITTSDFAYAKLMNCTIKLLGVAHRDLSTNKLAVYVSPVLVPKDHVIASIHGATNIVTIQSENLLSSSYVGEGAGRYPTANSIMNDVVAFAHNRAGQAFPPAPEIALTLEPNYAGRFYLRLTIKDGLGIVKVVGQIAEEAQVSLHAIHQLPIEDRNQVEFVVTTEVTHLTHIHQMCALLDNQEFTLEPPLALPMLVEE